MKKMMIIFAASLIVMFAACNKDTGGDLPGVAIKSKSNSTLNAIASEPAANPKNPYDGIGMLHNIVLDSLRYYVKTTKDTTRIGKGAYLVRYFKNHYLIEVKPFYNFNEGLGCTDYKSIMLTQDVSVRSKGFFKDLSNTLESIKDPDHYEAYKQQIVAIENKILSTRLPDDERRNLLMTASVLRYSGYYWMNAFRNGDVVSHNPNGNLSTDSFIRKIAGVIAGIGADASVIAYCYFMSDINIVDATVTWSEICGYYTGWW